MLTYGTSAEPTTPLVGSLRDAVATANGLLLLLRSRNVAPKTIAQLLPSLQDSFRGLPSHFEQLCASLSAGPVSGRPAPAPESLASLGPVLERQISLFNAAIEVGAQGTINARARLGLEQSVSSICHHLAALLALFELWSDTLRPHVVVDLVELLTLSRFGDQPPIPHRQVLSVKLLVGSSQCLVKAPPRAILNWLGLAAAVLAKSVAPGVPLGIRLLSEGGSGRLVFEPCMDPSSYTLALHLPATLAETETNLLDAVQRVGVAGVRGPNGLAFDWLSGELVMASVAN